ncbi:hypothetical protein BVX93_00200, partial [bacterium B13(2017)]
ENSELSTKDVEKLEQLEYESRQLAQGGYLILKVALVLNIKSKDKIMEILGNAKNELFSLSQSGLISESALNSSVNLLNQFAISLNSGENVDIINMGLKEIIRLSNMAEPEDAASRKQMYDELNVANNKVETAMKMHEHGSRISEVFSKVSEFLKNPQAGKFKKFKEIIDQAQGKSPLDLTEDESVALKTLNELKEVVGEETANAIIGQLDSTGIIMELSNAFNQIVLNQQQNINDEITQIEFKKANIIMEAYNSQKATTDVPENIRATSEIGEMISKFQIALSNDQIPTIPENASKAVKRSFNAAKAITMAFQDVQSQKTMASSKQEYEAQGGSGESYEIYKASYENFTNEIKTHKQG